MDSYSDLYNYWCGAMFSYLTGNSNANFTLIELYICIHIYMYMYIYMYRCLNYHTNVDVHSLFGPSLSAAGRCKL